MSVKKKPVERFCPTCDRAVDGGGDRCATCGTALIAIPSAPPADPLLGREIDGRYTLRAQLGAGGMGTVYRALQHSVGRDIALKVMQPSMGSDPTLVKRFLREGKLLSQLSHPNVVSVFDFGRTDDGLLYLAMELCEGQTLNAVIDREGRLPVGRAARLAVQICDALVAAHAQAIIHRDLKPGNIIVQESSGGDHVKILDFGLARVIGPAVDSSLTGSGLIIGTPHYIAPEQLVGDDFDERADLYALGVILYELLTGERPYGGAKNVTDVMQRQLTVPAPPMRVAVPSALEHQVRRLLERDPKQRPPSAAIVRDQLLAFTEASATTAPPLRSEILPLTVTRPKRRARWVWPVVLGGCLAIGGAGAFAIRAWLEPKPPPVRPPPLVVAPPAALEAPRSEPPPEKPAEAKPAPPVPKPKNDVIRKIE